MKLGIFIGRLNPPHVGHISTIKKALSENDKALVFLGTPKQKDEKNILNFKQRKNLLGLVFENNSDLKIEELLDNESDKVWTENIRDYILKNYEGFKDITFYFGDKKNDSVYIVLKQFEHIFSDFNLKYKEISRNKSFITHNGKKYFISATNLRKALSENNLELSEKFCDKNLFSQVKKHFL